MKALVVAEHLEAARELVAGARTLADEVTCVAFGDAAGYPGDRALALGVPEGRVREDCAATLVGLLDAEGFGAVLVEPTRCLRTVAGRLAAHAGTAAITDVTSFEEQGARSLYFGGAAERVRRVEGPLAVYTVAAGAFGDAGEAAGPAATVEELSWVEPERPVRLVSSRALERTGADLGRADAVVAAGRGFTEEGQLDLARALCERIGAGLGCSRPLTEGVGWLPSETYIGVSGLMLTPKVYVACGISGQMQHMVGCNRAGAVFAINRDKNAPIFKQCDYGLVGDLADVLPAVAAAL
ncbi:electron transfer flavoprotein subunit alpha/FixB family protein [Eggerthellaceae bacterium zg-1084]|uniref:Electron transfer flavoprotein subunit alpha/FixB family protein n=1 Tax=Berryella wangjianweii TaxID=2734634 RepID=A0A6M8J6J8_9ACTN|nr:electron transfer flavoprotein subunit alpha/FixB family protein [Berryella wangjianweii]NPD30359.1 electron transfer flavoprotein subunit alpha/FixB family protein [Berryella wangjianweii]QKF07039.1 electron transfer flavoprotein subunit alpha/FixB family protein [Berryella wangjianweii]